MTYTAEEVLFRFQEAGATLLALKVPGCWPRGFTSSMPEIVRSFADAVGADIVQWRNTRPPTPSAAAISRMEQAYSWLSLIPDDRFVIRRIVCARSLTCPMNGRPRLSWRRIGEQLRASHTAVQLWHAQGIDIIVARLNQPGLCARSSRPAPSTWPATAAPARAVRPVGRRQLELA